MSERVIRTQAYRFGRRMEHARQLQFLTVTQMAENIVAAAAEAGVELTLDRSAVSHWLAGHHEPHMKYRPFIAKVLNVDPHYLFEPVEALVYSNGVAS